MPGKKPTRAADSGLEVIKLLRERLELDAEADPALALSELFASFEAESQKRATAEARLEEFTNALAIKLTGAMLRSSDEILPLVDELLARQKFAVQKLRRVIQFARDAWQGAETARRCSASINDEIDLKLFEKTLAQGVAEGSTQHELQPDD